MALKYYKKRCAKGSISRRKYSYRKKSLGGRKINARSTCIKSKGKRSRGLKPKRTLPSLKKEV